MRRIDRVRLGMVFVLAALLMAPAAGWARVFNYARLHYFFLPIQMQFADRDTGNPIGKLLLIPMACAFFSIDNDVAMQVAGVGFIISVIQDSSETVLNSSTDVLFTAAVD